MSGRDGVADRDRTEAAAAIAEGLLAAYDACTMLAPITASVPWFDSAAAYDVLRYIEDHRRARGWRPVGRKIGFTNRTIWARYGVTEPMWARMWDRTVNHAVNGAASVSLGPFVQPRIEPEVVFGLAASPESGSTPAEVLSCVEWMSAGFEIVQCHFPEWRFNLAECTAAFGLHGMLVVGTPVPVAHRDLDALADTLATFDVTLSCDGTVVERGGGANVLGSPARALDHLVGVVAGQPIFEPLAPGEIVTTGTLTDAMPLEPGHRWTSDYGALDIPGLSVTFE